MPTDGFKRILGLVALAPGGALIVLLAKVQTCVTHLNRRHVQPVARLVGRRALNHLADLPTTSPHGRASHLDADPTRIPAHTVRGTVWGCDLRSSSP